MADLYTEPVSPISPLPSEGPAAASPPPSSSRPLPVTVHVHDALSILTLATLGRKASSTVASLLTFLSQAHPQLAGVAYCAHACEAGDSRRAPAGPPLDPRLQLQHALPPEGGHLALVRACLWIRFPCGLAPPLRLLLDPASATLCAADLKEEVARRLPSAAAFAATYRLHRCSGSSGSSGSDGGEAEVEALPESAPLGSLGLASGAWLAALPLAPLAPGRVLGRLAAQPWRGHTAPVRALALLPGGELLATGGSDGVVRLWVAATGASAGAVGLLGGEGGEAPQQQRQQRLDVNALCVLEDGRLAAGASDGYVRVLQLDALVAAHRGAGSLASSSVAALASSATLFQAPRTPAPAPAALPASLASPPGALQPRHCTLAVFPGHDHSGPGVLRALAALPGNALAAASACRGIRLLRVDYSAGEVAEAGGWVRQGAAPLGVLRGHEAEVLALCALSGGARLASGSADRSIRVWGVGSGGGSGGGSSGAGSSGSSAGVCLAVLRGCESWVGALAALPGGLLLSGSGEGAVRVWDTEVVVGPVGAGGVVGCCVRVMRGSGGGGVAALAVLGGGSSVAAGGYSGCRVRLWDVEGGACLAEVGVGEEAGGSASVPGERRFVHALCATSDGRLLCGSEDGGVHVYR